MSKHGASESKHNSWTLTHGTLGSPTEVGEAFPGVPGGLQEVSGTLPELPGLSTEV
ncbi:hypothetical protein [Sporocytophaga myxococcoides]|uniref:hypothetical protein n=1 Tax=Sporocytophaga myxococcoides TaxID=153721 RepID=UPI00040D1019|nr:hypothetical protein [Sporocytophaga myxococcoides]